MPSPVRRERLLLAPAERADVIVDLTTVPAGSIFRMLNVGPDELFGGGRPGIDFESADPMTTGQVMQFRVISAVARDPSRPPATLGSVLPPAPFFDRVVRVRRVSLNELESNTVRFSRKEGQIVFDCNGEEEFGPTAAMLGTLNEGRPTAKMWMEPVTEQPRQGEVELWEIYNFTEDAHPIHLHQAQFLIVNRQALELNVEGEAAVPVQITGSPVLPLGEEHGPKDTVIAYPGQVTRIKVMFDIAGRFVWHCHILEHEDNQMMRPLEVR
ncbi:MAG: multicopper oxidase domain-containing protein [Bryobacteraceae bacterium]